MAKNPYDPLRRDVPASEVPLQSPMPRSPILDREEPEASDEDDIAPEGRVSADDADEDASHGTRTGAQATP